MSHSVTVAFLANAYSPHVSHWISLLMRNSISVVVYTIHLKGASQQVNTPVIVLGRVFSWVPISVRYVWGGMFIRFFMNKNDRPHIIHAHNASGYGLMAYLSGVPYILTTYGSEIFQARKKGWLYCAIIKHILNKAILVTGTTESMAKVLEHDFGVPCSKISIFSLGLEGPFVYSEAVRQQARKKLNIHDDETPVFFSNRRIHPHYNVIPLVRAFSSVWGQKKRGLLLLLEGDGDKCYLRLVGEKIANCDGIKIIPGFIDQHQLCAYLCAADFVVSIPNSDQLSSSLLEAAECMNVPILSNIAAYTELFSVPGCVTLPNLDEQTIAEQLFKLIMAGHSDISSAKSNFHDFCANKYSTKAVDERIRKLYSVSDTRPN